MNGLRFTSPVRFNLINKKRNNPNKFNHTSLIFKIKFFIVNPLQIPICTNTPRCVVGLVRFVFVSYVPKTVQSSTETSLHRPWHSRIWRAHFDRLSRRKRTPIHGGWTSPHRVVCLRRYRPLLLPSPPPIHQWLYHKLTNRLSNLCAKFIYYNILM